MPYVVTRAGREVHGWEKALGSLHLLWGLVIAVPAIPIRLVIGRWPWDVTHVTFED